MNEPFALLPNPPGSPADFHALLQKHGLSLPAPGRAELPAAPGAFIQTQATTILAFRFADGVLVAGDRRATAGHTIMYDRADKVLEIDRYSLMAIAGVPATAWEMARVLEHSFHYFRRTQLAEMSLEGKVRALSKLLRDNLGFVLQGVGVVVPIFATYDHAASVPRMYFYDPMGAQFEAAEYAATGSGSPAVKAVLHYENSYARRPLKKLKANDAVLLALRALDTAAETDAATGGVDRRAQVFPIVKIINEEGITTLPESRLSRLYRSNLAD
jgi:proteasome beta subunit